MITPFSGHFALSALQKMFPQEHPPFTSQRFGRKATLASVGRKYVLLQCPTLMNVSGPWVAAAWKGMLADEGLKPPQLPLILVHDDLEEDPGVVKIKKWSSSHRGHNGVKSTHASLVAAQYPGALWARITIGIGRPDARDRTTVSDHVLRKMTQMEKSTIQDQSAPALFQALLNLERSWS
ncbi:hypothetical protein DL546_004398 [Coniochaeta pulveracea]|uniref:peptidyl-tRNA hydrolase n=1 Tax=Coniochaeta pulveracea TaxID=177199 RepID=A0A420Y826_9PEZI|nr:hypothetical protein DL546_004398 [Coniochaeta pulveracea]